MPTETTQFLEDLEAGVFSAKIGRAISNAARAAVNFGKSTGKKRSGAVRIDIEFEQIGDSEQVNVTHKLTVRELTARGKLVEENAAETPMHVHHDGTVSAFPPEVLRTQIDAFKRAESAEERS